MCLLDPISEDKCTPVEFLRKLYVAKNDKAHLSSALRGPVPWTQAEVPAKPRRAKVRSPRHLSVCLFGASGSA